MNKGPRNRLIKAKPILHFLLKLIYKEAWHYMEEWMAKGLLSRGKSDQSYFTIDDNSQTW